MRSELMKITPELAKKFLAQNVINRTLSDKLVQKYTQDILSDNWSVTHQGIAFYDDNSLADGQHRLESIVQANKPVYMYVTYGLKKEQSIHIDMHRPRSVIDGIKIGQLSDWIEAKHVAMVSVLVNPKRLPVNEVIHFLNSIEDSAKFAVSCFPTNRRYLTSSIIHAAICAAHYNGVNEDKLRRFGEVLLNGVSEGRKEKVIVLVRDMFIRNINNGSQHKHEKFLKVQRAIQLFDNNEIVSRLQMPKDHIYTIKVAR